MPYELYNFDLWEEQVQRAIDNWDVKKKFLLRKLGRIYQRQVKKLTPVDTGRLKASIIMKVLSNEEVEVGTNVEYAIFIEEGHHQSQRFVPGYWRDTEGFQYIPYFEGGGMMLSEKWVEGAHMFKKGMRKAKDDFRDEIEEFMQEIERELMGK